MLTFLLKTVLKSIFDNKSLVKELTKIIMILEFVYLTIISGIKYECVIFRL